MDPATILALSQLINLAVTTYQQYANGTITAAQATEMFNTAADNLAAAIAAFNQAGQPAKP